MDPVKLEPDFSGWATKAGLKCTDGRTIMGDAFKHQDQVQVPLVWQHGHNDPENVLGHAILENRAGEGVYCYCFFNSSSKAQHSKIAVEHKDINSLSIWANELVERSKRVFHGAIREVSLVLSGANPGALIENVTIRHSDEDEVLDDEVIIYTGLELEHASMPVWDKKEEVKKDDVKDDAKKEEPKKELVHAKGDDDDESIGDILKTFNDKQTKVLEYLVGEAMNGSGSVAQSAMIKDLENDPDVQGVYDSMDDDQKSLLHSMLSEALGKATDQHHSSDEKGNDKMDVKHNVFEGEDKDKGKGSTMVLSHSDVQGIVADAMGTTKSLKTAVEAYALAHGINDIDILFPEAKALTDAPEWISRRMEWVSKLLGGVRKSPFSRIKTQLADITVQEARAKGYIKGTLKKEEFFGVARRITTPTTIYKKQKLDRDDIIDITDFDVVVWLKGEMRIMLDEELARAILLGDGRAVDDEDKISEEHIRPVAFDHEVYTTRLYVPISNLPASIGAMVDEIALHRSELRGSGQPILWTTEHYLARMLLLKDNTGRKLYKNVDELATDMRVSEIVTVEVMEEYPNIVGVLFNPTDYVVGADKGGQVSMFDDFDIDYNQYKYLIETRASGALVKYKAAMVIMKVAGDAVEVAPAAPVFDGDSVTIVDTAGVVYRNADTDVVMNAAGSPYAVAPDATINISAEPADAGHYLDSSDGDEWSFTNNA